MRVRGLWALASSSARLVALASCAEVAYVCVAPERREAAGATVAGAARFTRATATALYMWRSYASLAEVSAAHGVLSAEYRAAKSTADLASARALLSLCQAHGGLYIKLAQYLSTLNHVLPPEFTETLRACQDRAQPRPWDAVARVFTEDSGASPDAAFASIEHTPLASASLAQVHAAVTVGGERVAVKIQYPELRRQVAGDLVTMRVLMGLLGAGWPELGYSWLWPEFHASIAAELSFRAEASNGERVAAMFAGAARVHVPRILHGLSSERVLVMELIEGVKVTDLAGLARLGVPPREVAREVSRFFGDQIHTHGFVHCDPHPGNLMVRLRPGGGARDWQLVVLDHGMYRRLSPGFRAAYCRLWRALVTNDVRLGERCTVELGLPPAAFETLSIILTLRRPGSAVALGARMSAADVRELKAAAKQVDAGDVNRFMQRLPRDMLFVLRASNMVRGLNKDLGGSARERFAVLGECAVRGLILTDAMGDFSEAARAFVSAQAGARARAGQAAAPAAGGEEEEGEEEEEAISPGERLLRRLVAWGVPLTSAAARAPAADGAIESGRAERAAKPLRAPRTLLNDARAGGGASAHSAATESELLAARRAGAGLAERLTLGLRRLRAEASVLAMRLRLLQLDAVFALWALSGSYVAHHDPRRPQGESTG